MDKVSVIVPIYNGEKYLDRCLESLVNQSYKNTEFIFVNDGSTDSTISILKKYENDNRVIIIDKKNTGVSDSRNQAIFKATGDYVCFCDADDFYKTDYIEQMLKTIKKYDVDVVRCNYNVISTDGKTLEQGDVREGLYNKKRIESDLIPLFLNGTIPCFSYLLMIKKDKLSFKFPVDIAMMEDVVFYLEMLTNISTIYLLDSKLYTIMYNLEGATNNVKNYKRNILNIIEVNSYIKTILKKKNLLSDKYIQNINLNHLNAIADFIFKHYLYSESNTISMIKDIDVKIFKIIDETNLADINFQRRTILKLIKNKHYFILKMYFIFRKIFYNLRRK